jgi:uracil-DNA glycosylase family 4
MSESRKPGRRYAELLELFDDYCRTGFAAERRRPAVEQPTRKKDDTPRRQRSLEKVAAEVLKCTRCDLCLNRLKAVPGEGVIDPAVLVVGEGPGADEDASGRPFVGAAGRYLDKWLQAIQASRDRNAFIANIVKCRPPENRDPRPEEVKACFPYLLEQISLLRPRAILCVGRVSAQTLLGESRGIGSLRGGSYFFEKIPLVPTYHPSAVLRDRNLRSAVWEDLKRLQAFLHHA